MSAVQFCLGTEMSRYHFIHGPKCLGTQKTGTELSGTQLSCHPFTPASVVSQLHILPWI